MTDTVKPILFSTPMVQAILASRKTHTRRVIKLQPKFPDGKYRYDGIQEGIHAVELLNDKGDPTEHYYSCGKPPYLPDNTLWVRETWKCTGTFGDRGYEVEFTDGTRVQFNFDDVSRANKWVKYRDKGGWQSPYFMPREAARLFLHVTDVRVERLQDMDHMAVKEEGIYTCCLSCNAKDGTCGTADCYLIKAFAKLWDGLNAKRGYGWDANPWVWVYKFERCEKPAGLEV